MKVAIIGTVTVSRMLAPFQDQEWEIWGCSPGNRRALPRVTRWFELHAVMDVKRPENGDWNSDYFGWLKEQTFPIYMQEPNELVPGCKVFPRNEWLAEFGDRGRDAATSSIALMIGYAIMQGAKEIGVFGVDMAAEEEAYTFQKPGCRQMLMIAAERGIKVSVPLESCLATPPPLYGYAESSRLGMKMYVRQNEYEAAITNTRNEIAHLERKLHNLMGALEVTKYVRRTFVDGVDDAEIDDRPAQAPEGQQTVVFDNYRNVTIPKTPPTIVEEIKSPEKVEVEKTAGGVLVPKPHRKGANSAAHLVE
jgi:hypothetical protein